MTETAPPDKAREAAPLLEEGLSEARALGNPVARARHLGSWAFRLSLLDPARAAALVEDCPDDSYFRARLLLTIVEDRARSGSTELQPEFSLAVEQARNTDPDTRLRLLNGLSEAAIQVGERDAEAGARLLRLLAPEARAIRVPPGHTEQPRALACALVGEGLLALGDADGDALLDQAETLARELPGREPLVAFLAGVRAERDPQRAAALLDGLDDPAARLESRLDLAAKCSDAEFREQLLSAAERDADEVDEMRQPEALVRLALAVADADRSRALALFDRALAAAAPGEEGDSQLHALQLTGIGAALAGVDRERAGALFREATDAALRDDDRIRRVGALVLMANEMASSHPREAAELFQRALEDASGLEALWELAHVLDLVFRQGRSPYLDSSAAVILVDRVLALLSDEDPRVPGVFGLAEAARLMLQVDESRAAEIIRRWLASARATMDTDAMTSAALALCQVDEPAGRDALRAVRDYLVERVDCPAMGEFARRAAGTTPELVLDVAERIPDARERADARARAAIALYAVDPERALGLVREQDRPSDRSLALMEIVDGLLGTGDRPTPQPLLEELP